MPGFGQGVIKAVRVPYSQRTSSQDPMVFDPMVFLIKSRRHGHMIFVS